MGGLNTFRELLIQQLSCPWPHLSCTLTSPCYFHPNKTQTTRQDDLDDLQRGRDDSISLRLTQATWLGPRTPDRARSLPGTGSGTHLGSWGLHLFFAGAVAIKTAPGSESSYVPQISLRGTLLLLSKAHTSYCRACLLETPGQSGGFLLAWWWDRRACLVWGIVLWSTLYHWVLVFKSWKNLLADKGYSLQLLTCGNRMVLGWLLGK